MREEGRGVPVENFANIFFAGEMKRQEARRIELRQRWKWYDRISSVVGHLVAPVIPSINGPMKFAATWRNYARFAKEDVIVLRTFYQVFIRLNFLLKANSSIRRGGNLRL